MASRTGRCQVMTIRNAKAIHAKATISAARDRIRTCSWATAPTPHHAANTNINCQANGLKYQCVPGGYEAKFQSNIRAPMYSRTEPSKVQFGRRNRHHMISGEAATSEI